MKFIEYFFLISLAVVVAAGFVFLWHRWNRTRTPLSFALAIAVTVLVAVIIAFSIATAAVYFISLL